MKTTDTYGATYVDHMGTDLTVVNAARVSFGKESDWDRQEIPCPDGRKGCLVYHFKRCLKQADARLIQFLGRGMTADDFDKFVRNVADRGHDVVTEDWETTRCMEKLVELLWTWRKTPEHWAPFAHPHVTFHVKAPIFVARQLAKHQVGFVWSEVSRRYVDDEPEFYLPPTWRKRAANVKQGSSSEQADLNVLSQEVLGMGIAPALRMYQSLLDDGVCPEQARMVLPQCTMTEWRWTGSLYGWSRVCNQRLDPHAQAETRRVAEDIDTKMAELFPVSWEALRP